MKNDIKQTLFPNSTDWMGNKWNIRRGFIKMHVMVDSKTKKIYAVSVTDDSHGDVDYIS